MSNNASARLLSSIQAAVQKSAIITFSFKNKIPVYAVRGKGGITNIAYLTSIIDTHWDFELLAIQIYDTYTHVSIL